MAARKIKNRKIAEVVKDINVVYKAIGRERDRLRELVDEAETILDKIEDTRIQTEEAVLYLEGVDRELDSLSAYL